MIRRIRCSSPRRTVRITAIAGVACVLALVSCSSSGSGSSSGGASSSQPFYIGVVLPFSGVYGVVGPEAKLGIEAAVNELNAKGGILGRQVKVEYLDSHTDTNKSVLATQQLISQYHPTMMIPDTASQFTLADLPLTTRAKILTVESVSAGSLNDPKKFPYNFTLSYTKAQDVAGTIACIKKISDLGKVSSPIKRVAVLTANDETYKRWLQAIQEQFPSAGLTNVGTQVFTAGASDVSVQLSQLKALHPDALIARGVGADVVTIANSLKAIGWTDIPVFSDSTADLLPLQKAIPSDIAPHFYFPLPAIASRSGGTVNNPFADEVKKIGDIGSLFVSGLDHDDIIWAAWAFNKAGVDDPAKAAQALESVSTLPASELPDNLVEIKQPGYSATDHSIANGDLSSYWTLGTVSPLINGTYQSLAPLTIPKFVKSTG